MKLSHIFLLCLFFCNDPVRAQTAACDLLGPNLILNPGFEQGYYGFTSDFGRGVSNGTHCGCATQGWILVTQTFPHLGTQCQYYPAEWSALYGAPNTETSSDPNHPSNTSVVTLATCNVPMPDHGSGTGYSLTIDPDACEDRAYWRQRIQVCPNTNYYFSVWVYNVSGLPAPTFHFEVAGIPVTPVTTYPDNFWVQSDVIWNSGSVEGLVSLALINDLPGCIANDVAIDDLYFGICGGVVGSSIDLFEYCPDDPGYAVRMSGHSLGFTHPQYQWQKRAIGNSQWENLAGQNDTLLLIESPGLADAGFYRLVAAEQGNVDVGTCSVRGASIALRPFPSYDRVDTVYICSGQRYDGHQASGLFAQRFQTVHGCDSILTLDLRVRGDVRIYMPNVFSPNDDGYNDRIQPYLSDVAVDYFLWQVFDRWGNLVFETNDPSRGWDGTFRGKNCEAGVYAYTLTMEIRDCQRSMLQGDLTLWR